MADNSSNNSSGPRNWRDRIGVKGDMPKLADEFKNEPKISAEPAHENPRRPDAGASAAPRAPQAPQNRGARPAPRPVARPAPMAPRRPAAAPRPAAPSAPPARPETTARASEGSSERSRDFAERLRAQREAAEALAKKRAEETRSRLSGTANTAKPANTGDGPKFSFAEEEIKAAAVEKSAPVRSAATPPPPPPRPPFRPVHTATASSAPPAYQPSDAYRQTHGYREYDDQPAAAPPAPPAYDRYAEAPARGQRGYVPPGRNGNQPPQSREPYYNDGVADDLFDDGPDAQRQAPRRAGASDYSAAYRDYDEAFDYDEEPRSRGGVWVFVVLMLIVVAAIAAGAYWFINYGTKIGSNAPAGGNVPTVTAPEQPVKVAPKPADTAAPGAPVRRKKIYDRILGNETLEPEKLVPSEETPQTPPPAVVPESAPAGDAPLGVQPLPLPLPPPPTVPGVQGGIQEGVPGAVTEKTNRVASAAPGASKAGQTVIAPTAAQDKTSAIQEGAQQAPLALPPVTAPEQTATPEAAPAPAPTGTPVAIPNENSTPEIPAVSTAAPPPLPRRKPAAVIARARQAEEQRKLAALTRSVAPPPPAVPIAPRQPLSSTGPVQLSPGTLNSQNFNTPAAPAVPHQPNTNIASLPPQARPPAAAPVVTPQQPAVTGGGYVLQMSTFRDRNAASAEYRRLISRHASILRGLSPEIREGDLGVSGKFYKLRLGSVANRAQAAQLCNALIAAGEKDCLVRSR